MFQTKEEEQERYEYLLKVDSAGHDHTCEKCKKDFYCPGITVNLWCLDRKESKCQGCAKHPKAVAMWNMYRKVVCHDCGSNLDYDPYKDESPIDVERRIYNPNSSFICTKCLNKGLADGTIQKPDDFFDKYGNNLIIEDPVDGEVIKVNIIDSNIDSKEVS